MRSLEAIGVAKGYRGKKRKENEETVKEIKKWRRKEQMSRYVHFSVLFCSALFCSVLYLGTWLSLIIEQRVSGSRFCHSLDN